MNCTACEGSRNVGLLFARLPLGLSLAYTGYDKFRHLGVEKFVSAHADSVPHYMPSWFGSMYLHAVPYAEMGLGALLVVGLLTRFIAFLTALMLVSFALAADPTQRWINEAGPLPFTNPVVYGCFALVALFAGPGRISLDGLLFRGKRTARRAAD